MRRCAALVLAGFAGFAGVCAVEADDPRLVAMRNAADAVARRSLPLMGRASGEPQPAWAVAATVGPIAIASVARTGTADIPRYGRLELVITLAASVATAPYDPAPVSGGVDLFATFTGPGTPVTVPGYFDGTRWVIRFAPMVVGGWTAVVQVTDASGTASAAPLGFTCVASSAPGFVRISGRHLRWTDGSPCWSVGHNTGWQYDVEQPAISAMAARGEDLLSFWIAVPWARPSDTTVAEPFWAARSAIENLEGGIGAYNQLACAYLDSLVAKAEAANVRLLPSIWTHPQLRDAGHSWGAGDWADNPYQSLCTASAFYQTHLAGVPTEQWRRQRAFLRYLLARWGSSPAIVGWVGLVEIEGTTGWVADQARAKAWCASVQAFMTANDPYRANAGTSPLAVSISDQPASEQGNDLRAIDSYGQRNSDSGIGQRIADQMGIMRGSGKPALITEFGGNVNAGASQPTHLHNGAWAGFASGAAMCPLLWTDLGDFPLLTTPATGDAMRDHLEIFAGFVRDTPWRCDAALVPAVISASSGVRAWGMRTADRGHAWIEDTVGTIGGESISIAGLAPGSYEAWWRDPWTGNDLPVSSGLTVAAGGFLTVAAPVLARKDIALRFRPINSVPMAAAQSRFAGAMVTIKLVGTDADGDPLSFAISALPALGTLHQADAVGNAAAAITTNGTTVVDPQHRVVFVPGAAATSFAFTVDDGFAVSAPATVTLTMTGGTLQITAADLTGTASTGRDEALTIDGDPVDASTGTWAKSLSVTTVDRVIELTLTATGAAPLSETVVIEQVDLPVGTE